MTSMLNRVRRTAHKVEVITGDVNAVKRGRVTKRITNRITGRLLSKIMRKVWR
jgi:hypothetical protein